ncbi:hypothetical protein JOD54_000812 [Actinokineospora baliensis]|uniref:HNH endonuclease n=1 Tax=Actinokineospora baliensis TaxID=547056 RepID=UPI001EF94543|nr:HNH endonuclease signature motif containing protein [Actinokineospora baliensis]MBM7770608.1 hypothetical protein [Actinokineospora baliensis]
MPTRTCVRCGEGGARPYLLAWPRKTWLCRRHATETFKGRRRDELARLAAEYDATGPVAQRAEAHHIALRAVTELELGCTPQPDPDAPTTDTDTVADVLACLAALAGQAGRYFAEFDQAHRAFPSARDRQRGRGNTVRAAARGAYMLAYDVPFLRRLYRDRCAYCGARADHIDHVWPLAAGGDDAPWNLAPACRTCNLTKGKRTLGGWLPARLAQLDTETRTGQRERWAAWR